MLFSVSLVILVAFLSSIDCLMTWLYLGEYKQWQPKKPTHLMEKNPLLVFLINKTDLNFGMSIGTLILIFLNVVIASIHWILALISIVILSLAIMNHRKNMNLLDKLMTEYPEGKLPEGKFGKVIGNNE